VAGQQGVCSVAGALLFLRTMTVVRHRASVACVGGVAVCVIYHALHECGYLIPFRGEVNINWVSEAVIASTAVAGPSPVQL
jgi:hypothetical protein